MAILKNQTKWEDLYYYRKTVVLYQMTVVFCRRFLPKHGDRTVDQMVQAARSCKQNIVEGSSAAATSSETEIKLTNVARASLDELREDCRDYLEAHGLRVWAAGEERSRGLKEYSRAHADWKDWESVFANRDAETLCNAMLTIIAQARSLLGGLLEKQETEFNLNSSVGFSRRGAETRRLHKVSIKQYKTSIYKQIVSIKPIHPNGEYPEHRESFNKLSKNSAPLGTHFARLGRFPMGRVHPQAAVTREEPTEEFRLAFSSTETAVVQ